MNAPVARLARSGGVHILFAFLAMGGWAVFANSAHAMPQPLIAGLVQGTLSACITLFLKRTVEHLAVRFRGIAALWLPPLVAASVSAGILSAIHALAGTPQILATIALPLSVATGYATVYNYSLWSDRKAPNHGRG